MTYKHKVGELRPSQILFSYGIGAIADLPNLSAMVMGLEDWDRSRTRELSEERLLAAVRRASGNQVKQLLLPPMPPNEPTGNPFDETSRIGIPVAPFPTWMVCPRCRLLAPLQAGFFELKPNPYRPNETCYVHKNCRKTRTKPPTVIPVRFLVACEKGHLDDFPWYYFVHRGNSDCQGPLRFEEYGVSGAATDIVVKCDGCDLPPRRLSDAFGEIGKQTMPCCRGRHPHLRSFDRECDLQMKSILLGASNSWFAITLSALSIPVASAQLAQLVEENWTVLGKATSQETLKVSLSMFQAMGQLQDLAKYDIEDIWEIIESKQKGLEENNDRDLKTPEWEIFSVAEPSRNTKEFQLRLVAPPSGFESYLKQTVLIERLREVRALIDFTRIQSPGDFADTVEIPEEYRARISRQAPTWVPATEVKGEGIFIQFKESALQAWEHLPAVKKYESMTREAHKNWLNSRNLDPDQIAFPGTRYILMHSFAHALMRQLSIECGYNAASLRERIYSTLPQDENGPQAGVLIYTAAPDSEGTLGGLVYLGEPQTLGDTIFHALEQMRLCASDPLCAERDPSNSDSAPCLHWAACHACLFAPETSCERGNKFLDRSVLVETLARSDLAFFS